MGIIGRRRARALAAIGGVLACAVTITSGPVTTPAPGDGIRAVSMAEVRAAASASGIQGLRPADIADAYGLSGGASGTVGIPTAYDSPELEADLAVYRAQWGLPACTRANGCLRVVGQTGTAALPAADADWAVETELDVQAVSAACPACSILVVEADSESMSNLGAATNTAVALGAAAVSMSWGGQDPSSAATANTISTRWFTHPGVALVAATGDDGYGSTGIPATLPHVIAVGGTTLTATSATRAARIAAGGTALQADGGDVVPSAALSAVDTHLATLRRAQTALTTAKAALTRARTRLTAARHGLTRATSTARKARTVARKAAVRRHAHPSATTSRAVTRTKKAAARAVAALPAARKHVRLLRTDVAHRTSALPALERAVAKARAAVAADRATTTPPITAPVATAPITTTDPTSTGTPAPVAVATTAPVAARTAWSETAWDGAGSDCSTAVAKPAWQTDTACRTRSVADVSAVADPETGLAVYATTSSGAGWIVVGGTSLASPLVTAMIVRSGHASSYDDASPLWAHPDRFHDVTEGANGSCGNAAICTAGTGYDGPTGLGTPVSLASF